MQHELVLKATTHGVIGLAVIVVLLVLLIGIRKEINVDEPIRGLFQLSIVVMGLCTFLALMVALFQARKAIVPEAISSGLDIANYQLGARSIAPHR